ncbi:MAG: hypothetical protein V4596_09715 [Bdellovibrionota bacterium]
MKIIVSIFIFLYSISSGAQSNVRGQSHNDGSYYNDDYIHNDGLLVQPKIPTAQPAIPVLSIHEAPKRKAGPIKSRRPAGGFKEVKAGGRAGDFIEVGEDNLSPASRGSK